MKDTIKDVVREYRTETKEETFKDRIKFCCAIIRRNLLFNWNSAACYPFKNNIIQKRLRSGEN